MKRSVPFFSNGFIALLCCVSPYFASGQAPADSSDFTELSLSDLMNIPITSVTKTAQKAGQAPATTIVVTEEQIRIRGYQSLLDVIHDLPDIKVNDRVSSAARRNNFTVRGVEGQEKFVILLDGIRISSATNEAMPIMENYPVNLAKQIEIVYGPASALYGADAMSGIINIITKNPEDKNFTVNASTLGGTYGTTNSTLYLSKKLSDDISFIASGQYYYDQQPDMSKIYKDDFDMTSHKTGVFNTGFGPMTSSKPVSPNYETPMKAYNVYAALKSKEFTVSVFKNYAQYSTSMEDKPDEVVINKDVFYGKSVTMGSISYRKELNKFSLGSFLTGNRFDVNPESNYRNSYSGMDNAYKYAFGSLIKFEQQIGYKASEKLNFIGGGTFESFYSVPEGGDLQAPVDQSAAISGIYLNSQSYYRPQGIDAKFYTLKYQNTGVYLQGQYTPSEKVSFTLGGRYDYNTRFGSTVNPRLGVVVSPTSKTTIKALYGSAYLAPSPMMSYNHYGTFFTADSGKSYQSYFWHLPNPDLKPILSKNFELSLRQYAGKNFSVTVTSYYTILTNLFRSASDAATGNRYNGQFLGYNVGYIEVFINQGKQVNYGGTVQLNHSYSSGNLKVNSYAALSLVDGFVEEQENNEKHKHQIDYIAPVLVKVGTDIQAGKLSFSPRAIISGKQRVSGLDANDESKRQVIDGYVLLNAALRYQFNKNFAVFSTVENALNQKYRNIGTSTDLSNKSALPGTPQLPMRLRLGVNFTI